MRRASGAHGERATMRYGEYRRMADRGNIQGIRGHVLRQEYASVISDAAAAIGVFFIFFFREHTMSFCYAYMLFSLLYAAAASSDCCLRRAVLSVVYDAY